MLTKVIIPQCIGCKKPPDAIQEYVIEACINKMTPIRFVMEEEGTYNRFEKNKFYCTDCYVKAGCPSCS